ncbi:MAG: tRNA (adenosine(37)-N6)-dimethylallyltransferase MiaA [Thermodesulfobacteriota bacterium]
MKLKDKENANLPPVIVLCGPTGVGKTAYAIELARAFGGQIVGADSMQIYRHMDIGTAKPTVQERQQVPHFMIDIVDPDEEFSAGQYGRMAGEVLAGMHKAGILPFLVGGTGLYIKACLRGLFREGPADGRVLNELKDEAAEKGAAAMYERLRSCDPESAERINPNDVFRIVRALELFAVTGRPASEHIRSHGFSEQRYNALKICLYPEREEMYQAIDTRVDAMLAAGFAEEVKGLLDRGYGPELKSMQSIGYRHMVAYLLGKTSRQEMVETMKRDTRRYAKRQLTWFRGDSEVVWVRKEEGLDRMFGLVKAFIDDTKGEEFSR